MRVTDEADAFQPVADAVGRKPSVGKSPGKRSTKTRVEEWKTLGMRGADGSLAAMGISPEPAVADLDRWKERIAGRPVGGEKEREVLDPRDAGAAPPKKGEAASGAYRIR